MEKIYDVIIVGAGPSGSTLSMLLQDRELNIAIIDKRPFDQEYDVANPNLKSCGGLLSDDAQYSISRLNLNIPLEVLAEPQILNVKTFDFDNDLIESYQRCYLNMNREKFDRFLSNQTTNQNVDKLFSKSVTKIIKEEDLYTVTYRDSLGTHQIKSKFLIGCDGAKSKVRNTFFSENNNKEERYASLQKVYKNSKITPQYISIFGDEITDYYDWGFTKDDLFYLGFGSRPGEDATAKFEIMKKKLEEHGYDFGEEYRSEGTVLIRPAKVKKIVSDDNTAFLIGEAGNFISGSSAEGISFGINSAIALADSFDYLDDPVMMRKHFLKNVKYLKTKVKRKNVKAKAMSNKTLRKIAVKSRVGAIDKIK